MAAQDRNMRIHFVAAAVVAGLLAAYSITGMKASIVVISTTTVLALEVMNVAVERLCDLVAEVALLAYPDERIKHIKDIAAGAVLLVAIGAAINGAIVFYPYLS